MTALVETPAPTVRWRGLELAWLGLCILLALFFRTINLSQISLWTDEFITLITVRRPFAQGILQMEDYSGPLYQLILRIFVHGDHPAWWVLRGPAILFGVLGVAVAWWVARMVAGRGVAALVAGLTAINPELILHAREARQNTLFVLLATLSMGFFLQMIRGGQQECRILDFVSARRDRIWQKCGWSCVGYVLCTVLLLYTHYFGFLVLAAQGAFMVWRWVVSGRRFGPHDRVTWAALVAVGLAGLPALWLMSRFILARTPAVTVWVNNLGVLGHVQMMGVLLGLPKTIVVYHLNQAQLVVLGLLMLMAVVAPFCQRRGSLLPPPLWGRVGGTPAGWGVTSENQERNLDSSTQTTLGEFVDGTEVPSSPPTRRDDTPPSPTRGEEAEVLCAFWVIFGFVSFLVLYYAYRPVLVERYALPVITPMLILILGFAARLGRWTARTHAWMQWFLPGLLPGVVAVVLAAGALSQFERATTYRSDMRGLVAQIIQQGSPGDPVLVVQWSYCEDYINPERVALAYYHLEDHPIIPLELQYPNDIHVLNPEIIPTDRHSFIVSWIRNPPVVSDCLKKSGQRFTETAFGGLHLFGVEPRTPLKSRL